MNYSHDDAIKFLTGEGVDSRGRHINDYYDYGYEEWEMCHDVIQWAFPTITPSAFNHHAPLLDGPVNHRDAMMNMYCLLRNYLKQCLSIDFKRDNLTGKHTFILEPEEGVPYLWLKPHDHNYRRLTRILECLDLFGLHNVKRDFGEFLIYDLALKYPERVNTDTVVFWVAKTYNHQL